MSLEQDVAAARTALEELERASARLMGHFRESVDSRRLRLDINRLRDDVDLLCGRETVAAEGQQFSTVVWDDGMDDSVGAPGRITR